MKIIMTTSAIFMSATLSISVLAADRREGEKIAKQWCSECHLTASDQRAGGDAAPPFAMIAESAVERADDMRAWLADPHPPMPNLSLTRYEIEDLLAYIQSLADK